VRGKGGLAGIIVQHFHGNEKGHVGKRPGKEVPPRRRKEAFRVNESVKLLVRYRGPADFNKRFVFFIGFLTKAIQANR
jgi:hypothetical protein